MKRHLITTWILISLFFAAILYADDEQIQTARLKGKNVVMVIPERIFHETEYEWLKEIFER